MILEYKEIENKITQEIYEIQEKLKELRKTIEETKEYGWVVTFNANTEEETIKSAFDYGRKIGELEGAIDQLNKFLNFLYNKEYKKEE